MNFDNSYLKTHNAVMKFSWDLIQTFEMVAQTGSLLAASKELGLSQPTVGRHIDMLEAALSVSLFVRSREGMELTQAGTNLVATSQDMVRLADQFKLQSLGQDDALSGVIRISANEVFGVRVLPALLREFLASHPEVEIELDITNSPANLLRRDADIALRMFQPVQNDLIARKITDIPIGFFAHRDYLAHHGVPSTIGELVEHRLIGLDRGMGHINWIKAMGLPLTASDFAVRSDNFLIHAEAIRTGLGIGMIHQGLARQLEGVEQVLTSHTPPALGLWLVCHAEVQHNRRVRLLMEFLAARLRHPYDLDLES